MTLDTAEKRFSMLSMDDGANTHLLFEVDGSVDADDRRHLLGTYSGIAFAAPAPTVPVKMAFYRNMGMI